MERVLFINYLYAQKHVKSKYNFAIFWRSDFAAAGCEDAVDHSQPVIITHTFTINWVINTYTLLVLSFKGGEEGHQEG